MLKNIKKVIVNKIFLIRGLKAVWRFFILFWLSAFLSVVLFIIFLYLNRPTSLELDYFDVVQGDSELIQAPNHKLVLIDGGPDNLVIRRLGENLQFYERKIDYVILSHFHDDHITGLIEVFKRYDIQNFIYLDSYDSPLLDNLLEIAKFKKIKVIVLKNSAQLNLDKNCFINLFNPNILKIKPDQNNSIVVKLECNKNKFLFSGDNSAIVEKALIDYGFDLRAKVLKASHHGSKTANSEAFLTAVKPVDFIISAGINNRFNHPSPEILERALVFGLKIFRTDKQGTIKIRDIFE